MEEYKIFCTVGKHDVTAARAIITDGKPEIETICSECYAKRYKTDVESDY